MRSLVALAALAALALSGSANLAAASVCRPHSSHTLASSNTATGTATDTTSSSDPTDTGVIPKVRNLASNGNMGEIDPEDPLAFPDWEVDGDGKIVGGSGRKEPGSDELGAAALSAANNGGSKKRDLGFSVSISQTIANLNLATPYTIRFYYLVVTSPQAINLCELTAYLGGAVFHQTWVFSSGMAIQWNEVLKSVTPQQVNAPLSIGMNCLLGGAATILVDSVFISNLVTPQNINNFAIDFGNTGTGANPPLTPSAAGPTTSVPAESSSFPVSEQETSWPATSGPEEQQTTWPATSGPEEHSTWYTTGPEEHSSWATSAPEDRSTWYTSGPEEPHTTWPATSGPEERSTLYTSGSEEVSWTTSGYEGQQTSEPESYHTSDWTEAPTHSPPTTTSSAPPVFCSKALNGGCWWKRPWSGDDMVNCASRGSWPGPDGQGWLVEEPKGYGTPWSQLWCLGWCSLSPGCKSVAWNPNERTCRFSKFEVQDDNFVHGPDPHVDTPGVYYWHDLSCFDCPCNDEPTTAEEIPSTAFTVEPQSTREPWSTPEPISTYEPTSEPVSEWPTESAAASTAVPTLGALKLPAASTCPKALSTGCEWANKQIGHAFCAYRGSWPGDDGAGWAVEQPKDYPTAWSQMWCVGWCALYPGCKSAAWIPADRSCRFSTHEVQDADFIPAPDPNKDSEGVYYWHDLSCMTCKCHDDIPTTLIRSTTTQASIPGGNDVETAFWPTPTPQDEPCEWENPNSICWRPFDQETGVCGGTLKIVNPDQYVKLPSNFNPDATEPNHCAILCAANEECGAWGFEWGTEMNCVLSLSLRDVHQLQTVSSGPQYRWYPRGCWECRNCVTRWGWTWDDMYSSAPASAPLPTETAISPSTVEEVYTTTTEEEPAHTTCPGVDEADKVCQRVGHTGTCVGRVDFVNPTNFRKVPQSQFPQQHDAVGVMMCAAICQANPDCQAFGWYTDIDCVIAIDNKSVEDLDWGVQSPQWYMWFDRDCFKCDERCVDDQYGWQFEPEIEPPKRFRA